MAYQIIADVTADMVPEMRRGLPRVKFISMDVTIGEETFLYGPGGDIDVDTFYQLQESGLYAGTSQINPAVYEKAFEESLKEGKDVLYFGFSSGISGSYSNSLLAAGTLKEKYPERKILCVDTLCASVGGGFFLRETLKKQAEGLSLEELADWIEEKKLHVCHWFTVDTFDHLRHGGRVSGATATMGTALNIKPLLIVDDEGKLEVKGRPRGRKHSLRMLLKKMSENWTPEEGNLVVIGEGDALDRAEELKSMVRREFPESEIFIAPIGPVIGAHTGPGMLALIFWGGQRE